MVKKQTVFTLFAFVSIVSPVFCFVDIVTTDQSGIWLFEGSETLQYTEGAFYFIEEGVEPWHLTKADFNGDGLMDVVSANRYGPSISVFINSGGAFAPPVNYQAGDKPYCTAAGDMDNDGDVDLFVANTDSAEGFVILENDGTGEFSLHSQMALGEDTYAVEAADLDMDGNLDLLVVQAGDDEVAVLLGGGDGTFDEITRLNTPPSPKAVAVGHFNSDELPDCAVANYDDASVTVFINDGSGFFEAGTSYSTGSGQPRFLIARDLDMNGLDDLVVAGGRSSSQVFVLYCEGDDAFSQADAYTTGPRPNGVAADDVTGDGIPDILAANWSLDNEELASISILQGGDEGKAFEKLIDIAPAEGFSKLTFLLTGQFGGVLFVRGDVNGDGRLSIVDPVTCLYYLFAGKTVPCVDAADVDDGGNVNLADVILLLRWLFLAESSPPSSPYPAPGIDPTPDDLP